jgi:hypothetical protein
MRARGGAVQHLTAIDSDQVAVADDEFAPVLGDRPGGEPLLGQVVEELGLAWRQPLLVLSTSACGRSCY